MIETLRSSRGRVAAEDGLSLPEMLVALSVLGVILTAMFSVLFNVQRGVERQTDRVASVDQARLAMEQIQHEVASARALTVQSGLTMDVYTRTNEDTRGASKCVQWRVNGGDLQTRTWVPPWTNAQTVHWRTVASSLTNVNNGTEWLFKLDTNTAYANRLLNITARVNTDDSSGSDVVIPGSAFARNVQYGVADPCATDQPT